MTSSPLSSIAMSPSPATSISSPGPDQRPAPGVIWITGFSAAGKTTIGRKVVARLRAEGASTVFLDGDDLRSIFGTKWGYTREDRVELAHVYFRFCSHLASQGNTVVIAAVAMYAEVSEWMHNHIPHAFEVYLRVPEEERRRRDSRTKKIYGKIGDLGSLYDEPARADFVVDNHGTVTPSKVAEEILRRYLEKPTGSADLGRSSHWEDYYANATIPEAPSPFALAVGSDLSAQSRILEVGCGNGRDASYFAETGHMVTALDRSSAAITACKRTHVSLPATFLPGTLPDLSPGLGSTYDAVYSRFVLHAMPLSEEVEMLAAAAGVLREDGLLFLECRSILDPLARKGRAISPTERIHGHYRRFIILEELLIRLRRAGFAVLESTESSGLAVHGDDDPVVIRIKARKDSAGSSTT